MIITENNKRLLTPKQIRFPSSDRDGEFGCINIRRVPSEYFADLTWFEPNCFTLTFAVDASGQYKTKANTYDIVPGTFFFSRPETFRLMEWTGLHEIYHVCFSEHFLQKYAGVELFKTFPFLFLENYAPKYGNQETIDDFRIIFEEIAHEYQENFSISKNIIANLLTQLLLKIKRNFWTEYDMNADRKKNHDIVRKFIIHLEDHYQQIQQGTASIQLRVNDYAKKQGIHENYLSNIVKEKTGKTVSHWISEKTILISKRLLENFSFSIKEISYRLGFPYISYFTIFFKKHTGFTPTEFRKMIA